MRLNATRACELLVGLPYVPTNQNPPLEERRNLAAAGVTRDNLGLNLTQLAEGVGFEPTVTCATHAFQACRFGRSRNPPVGTS